MKRIKAYEFKDLGKETQIIAWRQEVDTTVDFELDFLAVDWEEGRITEEEYYQALGCTRYYAESTSWFVPACYYEKHRTEVNRDVKDKLSEMLFTKQGSFIQTITCEV